MLKNLNIKTHFRGRLILTIPKYFNHNLSNNRSYNEIIDERNKNFCKSTENFSNFLRMVKTHNTKENLDLFSKDIIANIKNLDQFEMRKVHSLIVANPELMKNQNMVDLLKAKNEEIRKENKSFEIDIKNKKGRKKFVYRFYFMYVRFRERAYRMIELNFGIILK